MEKSIILRSVRKDFTVTLKGESLLSKFSSLLSPQKKIVNAVSDLSFSLEEGEFVGFIGPNGAGKTTTLKMLSGILYPSRGFISVLGFTPTERKNEFLRKISLVMGQKNQLWWDLPAIDSFDLIKSIYELTPGRYKRNLDELVTLLNVGDLLQIPVRRLSLGQRMRLELVAALLHHPKVIFLDEPTIGLDVVAAQSVRDFLEDYNKRFKATIILTSHNMSDIMHLTKRVIVINNGGLVFDGNLSELVNTFATEKRIKVTISQNIDYKKLEEIGKIEKIEIPEVILSVPRSVATLASAELLQSFPIDDLTIEEESLDSIIGKVYSGKSTNKVKKKKKKA